MYLGYKDKPAIRRYLADTFGKEFERLRQKGILENKEGFFYLTEFYWLKKTYT